MEGVTLAKYGPHDGAFVLHSGGHGRGNKDDDVCGGDGGDDDNPGGTSLFLPRGEKAEVLHVPGEAGDALRGREVVVQNYYSALNPVDYKIRNGHLATFIRIHPGASPGVVLGQESSGRVVRVGSDVKRFRVGDEVLGMNNGKLAERSGRGTYCQYSVYGEEELAHKPREMPHYVAATLPTAALSTYQALVQEAGMHIARRGLWMQDQQDDRQKEKEEEGEPAGRKRVLILGASGGVGTFAMQFAKQVLDAEVYAVCSASNARYARVMGADHVIQYDRKKGDADGDDDDDEAFENEIPDVDVVMDLVGSTDWRRRVWSLVKKRKGTYVCLGTPNEKWGMWQMMKLGAFLSYRKTMHFLGFGPKYHLLAVKPDGERLEQLAKWHADLNFKTCIFRNFTGLHHIPTAHKLLESREVHHRGKILIQLVRGADLDTPAASFIHQYREQRQPRLDHKST